MNKIPINKTGIICNAESKSCYITVKYYSKNSTDFSIFISDSLTFSTEHTYDYWVENEEDLWQFFQESGWEIDWL